jgi:hypothetical protein
MPKTRTFIVSDSPFKEELVGLADANVRIIPISAFLARLEERKALKALRQERAELREWGATTGDIRLIMKLRRGH